MKGKTFCRWAAALLAVMLLLCAGWALRQGYRLRHGVQGSRLARTDLPGFAPTEEQTLVGLMPAENHTAQENTLTLTDDAGRCWRLRVPGWSLLWTETNAVGAVVQACRVDTGVIRYFYLGRQADTFAVFPRTMGEELYADALSSLHHFLFWNWRSCSWTEEGFRAFLEQMTVEAVPAGQTGQRVALGDRLDLQQTADFNGSLLLTGDRVAAPQLVLREQAPAAYDGAPGTDRYTGAGGLTWTLQWWTITPEVLAEKGMKLAARCEDTGDWVELLLDDQYLADRGLQTQDQALEAAREALDHILPRA